MAGWKVRLLSQGGRLILLKHVLSCMATHLLVVLSVQLVSLKKINSILSTFFWGDVCADCGRGLGLRKFVHVQRSFHMKFAWRLLTLDNLWTRFFKAKYVKSGHLALAKHTPACSWFWKSVMRVLPDVCDNIRWCI